MSLFRFFSGSDEPQTTPDGLPLPDQLEWRSGDGELSAWRGRPILDVREAGEPGHPVPAGHHVVKRPLSRFAWQAPELDPEQEWLVVCAHGSRSLVTTQRLRAAGFRCWSLKGGMEGLRRR